MAGEMKVSANVKEAKLMAVVHRCRCGDPDSHVGAICPQAEDEEKGTVAFFSRSPTKMAAWLKQTLQGK